MAALGRHIERAFHPFHAAEETVAIQRALEDEPGTAVALAPVHLHYGIRVVVIIEIVGEEAVLHSLGVALVDGKVVEQGLLDGGVDLAAGAQHHRGEGGLGRGLAAAAMGAGLILRGHRQGRGARLQLEGLIQIGFGAIDQLIAGGEGVAVTGEGIDLAGTQFVALVEQQIQTVGRGLPDAVVDHLGAGIPVIGEGGQMFGAQFQANLSLHLGRDAIPLERWQYRGDGATPLATALQLGVALLQGHRVAPDLVGLLLLTEGRGEGEGGLFPLQALQAQDLLTVVSLFTLLDLVGAAAIRAAEEAALALQGEVPLRIVTKGAEGKIGVAMATVGLGRQVIHLAQLQVDGAASIGAQLQLALYLGIEFLRIAQLLPALPEGGFRHKAPALFAVAGGEGRLIALALQGAAKQRLIGPGQCILHAFLRLGWGLGRAAATTEQQGQATQQQVTGIQRHGFSLDRALCVIVCLKLGKMPPMAAFCSGLAGYR